MKKKVLILGGVKSGKSERAEKILNSWTQAQKIYIATYQRDENDREMTDRLRVHQSRRGSDWKTIETDHRLPEVLDQNNHDQARVLVDCLTLWLGCVFNDPDEFNERLSRLIQSIEDFKGSLILVSGEVGQGVVPSDVLTRKYRDAHGVLNQKVAQVADTVEWVVAGIPQVLKGTLSV